MTYCASRLDAWYKNNEPENKQFDEYVRLCGYGRYRLDSLDPQLQAALVAWDDQQPAEVQSLLSAMWRAVEPGDTDLRFDLLRDFLFTRCQSLFAAHPAALQKLFVDWVKKKLVDNKVVSHEGQTIYTFSLKAFVPFLFCLLGAQGIAKVSAKRCDEILCLAVKGYITDPDLMTSAARLYASDKGLAAVEPPVPLKDRDQTGAWQTGVVEAALPRILISLLAPANS